MDSVSQKTCPAIKTGTAVCDIDRHRPINEAYQRLLIQYIFSGIMEVKDVKITWTDTSKKIHIKVSPQIAKLFGKTTFEFENVKEIGAGTYGTINFLYCKELQVELALKRENLDPYFGVRKPIEEEISRMLLGRGCNTVNVKFISIIDEKSFYLMNKMEGNLNELAQIFRSDKTRNASDKKYKPLRIVEEIRKQMLCIYNIIPKYVYTDYKLVNILYDCPDKSDLTDYKIHLGDLGSAVPDIDGEYISSYPPYEFKEGNGFIKLTTDKQVIALIAWGLGILLLSFIEESVQDSFKYNRLDSLDTGKGGKYKRIIKLMTDTYSEDIAKLLSLDPDDRPNIKDTNIIELGGGPHATAVAIPADTPIVGAQLKKKKTKKTKKRKKRKKTKKHKKHKKRRKPTRSHRHSRRR